MKIAFTAMSVLLLVTACQSTTDTSPPTIAVTNQASPSNQSDDAAVTAFSRDEIKRRLGLLIPYCLATRANKPIDSSPLIAEGYVERTHRSIGTYYVDSIRKASTFKNQVDYALYPDYRGKCMIVTPINNNDLVFYPASVVQVMVENGYMTAGRTGGRNTYRFSNSGNNIEIWIQPNFAKGSASLEIKTF